jgi:hypothetical protein
VLQRVLDVHSRLPRVAYDRSLYGLLDFVLFDGWHVVLPVLVLQDALDELLRVLWILLLVLVLVLAKILALRGAIIYISNHLHQFIGVVMNVLISPLLVPRPVLKTGFL